MPLTRIYNDCDRPCCKLDESNQNISDAVLLAAYEDTGLKPHEIVSLQNEFAIVKAQRDLAIQDLHVNTKCTICQNLPPDGNLTHCVHYASCGLAYVYFKWRGEKLNNSKTKE